MESFEVKQTFDRKQEASWEPEKFGLGPADTADLSKQYNTICLPLVEPEHFIEILQMTASTAKDIEALRAELARRMAELCGAQRHALRAISGRWAGHSIV
ncbi:hypothetical protein E5D57_013351 [Metarhizium anisopliae]|nr:hypothetical protein E5D57_013351 [Metarhizium anisopliae]